MLESNPAVVLRLIAETIGGKPFFEQNRDGTMSLHIGQVVITAPAVLWCDPHVPRYADGTLPVGWGGRIVRIPSGLDAANGASGVRDTILRRARQVF